MRTEIYKCLTYADNIFLSLGGLLTVETFVLFINARFLIVISHLNSWHIFSNLAIISTKIRIFLKIRN